MEALVNWSTCASETRGRIRHHRGPTHLASVMKKSCSFCNILGRSRSPDDGDDRIPTWNVIDVRTGSLQSACVLLKSLRCSYQLGNTQRWGKPATCICRSGACDISKLISVYCNLYSACSTGNMISRRANVAKTELPIYMANCIFE